MSAGGRVTLVGDSMPTEVVRAALAAHSRATCARGMAPGNSYAKASLNGPEKWAFESIPLTPSEAYDVMAAIEAAAKEVSDAEG